MSFVFQKMIGQCSIPSRYERLESACYSALKKAEGNNIMIGDVDRGKV